MKEGYSQSPEKVRTGNVANKERKEETDKDVKERKKLSGTEKKAGPWKQERTLGELLSS